MKPGYIPKAERKTLESDMSPIKKCYKCDWEKDITFFFRSARTKDGLMACCKDCCKDYRHSSSSISLQKRKDSQRAYYEANKKAILQRSVQWNREHPESQRTWAELNKEAYREYRRRRHASRKLSDPRYVSIRNIRGQVLKYLKSEGKKLKTTEALLGYTYPVFFEAMGLAPNLHHLDHKIPVSWFLEDASVSVIFDIRNLQWLSNVENLSKSNKFAHPVSSDYWIVVRDYLKEVYKPQISVVDCYILY